MLTANQMASEIAIMTNLSTSDVKSVFEALETVVLDEIAEGQKVKIGQLVQIQPKIRKARKARMGRNPRTGEDVKIPAKKADVVVKSRVLKRVNEAAPTMAKAKKAGLK